MTWFHGFWCKYRFAKRIGQELGSRCADPAALVVLADRHIRRSTGAAFAISTDCHQRAIVAFVETKRKGDLSRLKATLDDMKAVGRILYGDGREHEPCWFTDDLDDASYEDERDREDDDPLPLRPWGFYNQAGM